MDDHEAGAPESFQSPPVTRKEDGELRRVGYELEFSGLDLDQTAEALRSSLGGRLESQSAAERVLRIDPLGTFRIEMDWDFLKRKAEEHAEDPDAGEWVDRLSEVAAILVPLEVVCPPIPLTELTSLHPMVAALREAGAVGTEKSLLAAYGVHINVELPRLEAATLSAYLRSFAALQWWLVEAHDVDTTRRITPYVDLYPEAYVRKALSRPDPTLDEIFSDYLEHNASRNRALDLLPLLAELDAGRVQRAIDDPRIQARPALHYRLSNCHIERADWSLAASWNRWCVVERLAHNEEALAELAAAFQDAERPLLGVSRSDWVAFLAQWLRDHELA